MTTRAGTSTSAAIAAMLRMGELPEFPVLDNLPPSAPRPCGLPDWGETAPRVCDGAAHYDDSGHWLGLCPDAERRKLEEQAVKAAQRLGREVRARDDRRLAGLRQRLINEAERLDWKRGCGIGIDSFDPSKSQGGDVAKRVVPEFVERSFNLLLHGDAGTGKTGLLFGLRDALMVRGVAAVYLCAEEWRTWIRDRDSFNREVSEPAQWWLDAIARAPVVLLDELAARDGDVRNDAFPAAVANWFDRSGGKLAVATNSTFEEFGRYGPAWSRVVDRMRSMVPVELRKIGRGTRSELAPPRKDK